MTNPKRGELEIVLGDKTYQAKVTLDGVMRIEQSVGMSIVRVARALAEGSLTATQTLSILTIAIRSGGKDVSEKEVGKQLWDAGLADGLKAVGLVVTNVLSGGDDEGNEEQAEGLL